MGSVVETQAGKVEGFEREGLQVFRGIPYAKPPVGALRFRSPQPAEPWSGVRAATAYGPSAPQRDLPIPIFEGWDVGPQDEDCLHLNVTTPAADGAGRPVLVWIHGGGFTAGSGSQAMYDVEPLVRRGDVVIVTINYRLGPLGFLHLDDALGRDFGASGNAGLEDQVLALRWVRDNIAGFGGDPGNVTIFGESAGGMSVGTLLGTPSAAGLYQRAIPQSGAAHNASTREEAGRVTGIFLEALGLAPGDAAKLRELPVEQLLAAHDVVQVRAQREGIVPGLPFQPVVDGRTLPAPPLDAIAGGLASEVDVLVGSTRDEWNLLGMMDPGVATLDEDGLLARLGATVGGEAKRLVEAYRSTRGAGLTPKQLFFAIQTDRVFRIPAIRLAQAQAAHPPAAGGSVHQYLFTWEAPGGELGSCHGIEVPFVFGVVPKQGPSLFGHGPEAEALSLRTMDAWLAFARSGEPGHGGLPPWPTYDTTTRTTMLLGASCEAVDAPFDEERRAWEGLL